MIGRTEVLFCLAAWALGSAAGLLRGLYLIRKHDLAAELATVLALPDRSNR